MNGQPDKAKGSRLLRRLRVAGRLGNYGVWRILLLSAVVGVVAGLGAIAFYWMLDAAKALFLGHIANYHPPGPGGEPSLFGEVANPGLPRKWILLVLPALGGLISGAIVFRFAPEAEGHGTDAAIEAYHHRGGRVRGRVPLVKAIASALTIGSGGSGGREGPIAQIGAGFASMLAGWLKLSVRERRMLMAAGMAAGVGAIFHAPMAGALFAAEVLYRDLDLEYEVLIPSIIASIVAYAVFALQFGWDPLFVTPEFAFRQPTQLLPYSFLALAVAGGAILYIRTFYGVKRLFDRSPIPPYLRPAVGGLVVGVVGWFLPQALGTGYGVIQQALVEGSPETGSTVTLGIGLLLAVFAGKIVTTAFSIGSGGSGGVFGPAVVIGGALGGAVGLASQRLLPGIEVQPGAFVIVGMAGFFAAAANTPISTIIMVSEMTGNYHLLVPAMWVCILAYVLVRRHALYQKQLQNRFAAPVHMSNMIEAVLRNISVGDIVGREGAACSTVSPEAPLRSLMAHFAELPQSTFPVVGAAGRLVGMVQARELRSLVATRGSLEELLIAEDIMGPPVTVSPADSLLDAVRRMSAHQLDEILVVAPDDPHQFRALLNHRTILSAYHGALLREEAEPR